MKYIFLTIILFAFLLSHGQDASMDTLTSSGEQAEKKAVVKKVVQLKTQKPEASLEDYIKVKIDNIESLQKTALERKERIILFFNEIPMHGIYADFISTRDSSIIFKLTRDTASRKAWNIFYQGQTFESRRKVAVSVGFENDGSLDTEIKDFALILVRKTYLIIALIGIAIIFGLFILLVKKTGIIRDDNFMDEKGAYSLSRTQLAFWTFIVIISFIYIWIVTGEMPSVTGSTLVLLTISMATTAGAKVIQASKTEKPSHPEDAISDGFFKDIISDHSGVSIHRFQMVIWTVVLGVFFIRGVVKELAMPQFEDSLLMLMGISSGTYLGLKIPEKTEAPATPAIATPALAAVPQEDNNNDETPPVG